MIIADPLKTQERVRALEAYCQANVHNGCELVCVDAPSCKNSRSEQTFYGGQLSHVGKHFDLTLNGAPLRIVISGQEYGHAHENVTVQERIQMISGRSASAGFSGRNPHMKGTTSILRAMLDREPGTDLAGEQLLDGHVFDGFALVNALLCTSLDGPRDITKRGGGKGRSSLAMQRNCVNHYLASLRILDPTVIVLQGQNVRKWVGEALGIGKTGAPMSIGWVNGRECPVITFDHPSAGGRSGYWGNSFRSTYLQDIVIPTIQEWRRNWNIEKDCGPQAATGLPGLDRLKRRRDTTAISEGVALSWDDPVIRAKRMKRWTCFVDGTEFSSVKIACLALRYKDTHHRHIAWRGDLVSAAEKDGGSIADEYGRRWRVEPRYVKNGK